MEKYAYIFIAMLMALIILRITFMLYKVFSEDKQLFSNIKTFRTIVCIGSGGHTTEMLRLMSFLNTEKYKPRLYVVADNDSTSEFKIHNLESDSTSYTLCRIPRSRNVNQSYISSIFSTIYATLYTIPVVNSFKPNLILCNGPGTCIPICIVAFILKCMFIIDCRIVFIESLCRVRSLSLSGKILQFFADVFIVQWPQLRAGCFRAKYFGRLT